MGAVYISSNAAGRRAWTRTSAALLDTPTMRLPTVTAAAPVDATVRDLVERAQAGETEAFGQIYDRYMPTVHRFVYFRVGNRQLAEDITADTFVRALKRIGNFTWQGRDLGAWLTTIARNLIADHFKSTRHRLETTVAEVLDPECVDTSIEGDPEAAVISKLTNETLLEAIRKLNGEQQECIRLRFIQGLSVAETATTMGKSAGAIKAMQYRAVNTLAKLLPEGFHPATRGAVRSAARRRPVPAPDIGSRQ